MGKRQRLSAGRTGCLALIALMGVMSLLAGGCSTAPEVPARSESVTIQRDGIPLAAELRIPAHPEGSRVPLAIVMHGLGGDMGAPIHLALESALADRGFATLRFDFDGHGRSGGDFTAMTVPGEIADARAVYDYAHGLDVVSSISLVGHSQGAVVSAVLAGELAAEADGSVAALALLAPAYGIDTSAQEGRFFGQRYDPADPPGALPLPWGGLQIGRDYLLTAKDLRIAEVSARFPGPVLIIQGTADEVLLSSNAEEYAGVFPSAGVSMADGEDHNFSHDPQRIADEAADFLAANRPR